MPAKAHCRLVRPPVEFRPIHSALSTPPISQDTHTRSRSSTPGGPPQKRKRVETPQAVKPDKKGNDFWSAQWSQYMTSTIEWDENLFKPTPVILPHMLSPDALPPVINATATTNPEGTRGLPDAFNSGAFEDLLGVLQRG
ncbi:hypothetical protein BD779DRAFT_1681785 [Infundibulicybe gibba]|nr:hypothetical protein BD779DRAFT_1681785 [Infundibulicybe gibba]